MGPPDNRRLFAAVVFVASTIVLAIQIINPSPVVVSVGENGAEVAELHNHFRYRSVGIITVSACLLGGSGTYLLTADPQGTSEGAAVSPRSSNNQDSNQGGLSQPEQTDREVAPSEELLDARRNEWEETAQRLANNEEEIYETLLEADGVLQQSEIVDQTELSKATVSRTLDSLEVKNLVERKRRGMGNIVLLL